MTTPTVRAFTGAIPDTALVLAKRKLRYGLKLAGTSRFGDDVWVLSPAIHQKHLCARILDFRRLPDRFRLVAKELFYLLLIGDLPPDCASIKGVTTIHHYFGAVRYFLDWVDERQAAALSALTPADFDDFERRAASERIGEPRRRFRQRAARLFWLCHAKLTADCLVFDPAAILAEDGSADGPGSKHGLENATARIPSRSMPRCWSGRCAGSMTSPTNSCAPAPNGQPCTHTHRNRCAANEAPVGPQSG
jgi:hypothetical protein